MIYEYIIKNSFDGKGTIDQIESLEPLPISENEGLYIKKEYYKIDSIEGFMYFKQPRIGIPSQTKAFIVEVLHVPFENVTSTVQDYILWRDNA